MKSTLSLFFRLLPLLYALFFSHSVIAQQLFWLGTLGGLRSDARAVSADGRYVTGWSQAEDGAYYPFRWDRETQTMENLGSFGGRMSEGVAISADGRFIVGQSRDSSNRIHAFLWDAETRVLQNISPRKEYPTGATGISADGRYIVGFFSWETPDHLNRAFIIDRVKDTVYYLPTLGGSNSGASNISANGKFVVGESEAADGRQHAFLWNVETDTMIDLGKENETSMATAVSNNGTVIGHIGSRTSWIWFPETNTRDLLGNNTVVTNISPDARYVLGNDGYPNSFAALWDIEQDTLYNLNERFAELLTPSSKFTSAAAISADNRYIVGSGYNGETNRTEGFLLDTYAPSSTKKDATSPSISVFPNPFHHSTNIRILLAQPAMVTIQITDILGNLIYVSGRNLPQGMQRISWYGIDNNLRPLPSGAYICKVLLNSHHTFTTMLFINR